MIINVKNAKAVKPYKYHPETKDELLAAIEAEIKIQGNSADLNCIDTSKITDMGSLFYDTKFDGDISGWDVSNVKTMSEMFFASNFNGDISGWDVSNVKYMSNTFKDSPLSGKEPKWYKK